MSAVEPQANRGALRTALGVARAIPVVWILLAVLLIWIASINEVFATPEGVLAYLKRSAPLAILAVGAYWVLASGEFDLSVGSLVTVVAVVAAKLLDADPGNTVWVLAVLLGIGAAVGLVNGFCTTVLRVPSFIVTLATLLMLNGAVFLWTGGAPVGELADNFRALGREGIEDVPGLGTIPWSALILIAIVVAAALASRGRFGRRVLAVGDNDRAAELSGIDVRRVRTTAFVLSGLCAAVAGILLAGFAGVTAQVGQGLEFQAITAAVVGGVLLGGGRGSVLGAVAGALVLEALFQLLTLYGVDRAFEQAFTGLVIVGAVAVAAFTVRRG